MYIVSRAWETFTHVGRVDSAGKLNGVASASGLRGLLLGDGLGAVVVVLHGNYSKGCRENGQVRVGKTTRRLVERALTEQNLKVDEQDGKVLVWRSITSPGECVQRLCD